MSQFAIKFIKIQKVCCRGFLIAFAKGASRTGY